MPHSSQVYDVVILGSGPAGLQAAIHASRKKASVLVLGRLEHSSLWWAHVENLCCQVGKVDGQTLLRDGRGQAEGFGAKFIDEDALLLAKNGKHFELTTESGDQVASRSLIIATGTSRNTLGVPGEKELLGKGVSYCVDCDGGFFRGETVAVVGCQSGAAGGALTLLQYGCTVHLVCDELKISETLRKQLAESGVVMHEGVKAEAIPGTDKVEGLILAGGETLDVSGVFIELGAKGVLELAATLGLELDESMKYLEVDRKQTTNVKGVYAAGDICGPPLQIAKAMGEGCVAGIEAATYARKLKGA